VAKERIRRHESPSLLDLVRWIGAWPSGTRAAVRASQQPRIGIKGPKGLESNPPRDADDEPFAALDPVTQVRP